MSGITEIVAEVWFCPELDELRFLPEGPYPAADGRLVWVAIQHGPGATHGSVNLLDLTTRQNTSFPLPGRPGFAFPTDRTGGFVIGMEREVVLFDTHSGTLQTLARNIDADVEGTIINDAVVWEDSLILGCKDLNFAEPKAGLYLLRAGQSIPIQLRHDQVCSNGKAVLRASDQQCWLIDICSHSQRITRAPLDVDRGQLGPDQVVVDLTGEEVFPDGMILTPDEQSLIVAIYDPRDRRAGEARQYDLQTGTLQRRWICPGSPRVTCPQLLEVDGQIRLILTTADEGMPAAMRDACPHAGCLFVAETPFSRPAATPLYTTEAWP